MKVSQVTYIPYDADKEIKRFLINTTNEIEAKEKADILIDSSINDYRLLSCIIIGVH